MSNNSKKKKWLVKWTYVAYEYFEGDTAEEALLAAENDDPPPCVNLDCERVEVLGEHESGDEETT